MTEWMPNFLNRPFSWAITMDEQSVKAIIPNFIVPTSGEPSAYIDPTQPCGIAPRRLAAPKVFAERARKFRRLRAKAKGESPGECSFGFCIEYAAIRCRESKSGFRSHLLVL